MMMWLVLQQASLEVPHEWMQWVCGVEGKQNYSIASGGAESSQFMV